MRTCETCGALATGGYPTYLYCRECNGLTAFVATESDPTDAELEALERWAEAEEAAVFDR